MSKINFGIIGAGLWGGAHAEIYSSHSNSRPAAVCDMNENKAKHFSTKYGTSKIYREYQELINDHEVDAAAIRALGKNVLEIESDITEEDQVRDLFDQIQDLL